MPELADSSVGNLFTIPAADWTAINQRVGEVLFVQGIQDYITRYLPGYPALLASSRRWKDSTFNGLITESHSLENYAGTAIADFGALQKKIDQVAGNTVPDGLKSDTMAALHKLAADTAPLANAAHGLSAQVLTFLNDNRTVDAQIAAHKEELGDFWAPLGEIINSLENAAGRVTGSWRAITDDLDNAIASPIDVTVPFIESLNIQAALVIWKNLQSEAAAFSSMASDQPQYWEKP